MSDCHIISGSNEHRLVQVTGEGLLSKPAQSIYSHKSVLEEGWGGGGGGGGGGRMGEGEWWRREDDMVEGG